MVMPCGCMSEFSCAAVVALLWLQRLASTISALGVLMCIIIMLGVLTVF